ncbi:MAG: ATP-binding protein [Planctomycetota bacterium]
MCAPRRGRILAGRAAILRLLPLSRREITGHPRMLLPWERKKRGSAREALSPRELWTGFLRGGYPEMVTGARRNFTLWHASYVETYLARDVRALRQVGSLSQVQVCLRTIAARSAQLLNLSSLARDLGIAVNTVKAWLSVLEASYQIILLRPHFANVGKRLVKAPKVYFSDVGTLCYLTGLRDPEHAAAGPMAGAILETAALAEIHRTLTHRGEEPRLSFWRTSTGEEVDILVERAQEIIPLEVKRSSTPRPAMAAGIASLRRALGARVGCGFVVHPGDVRLPLGAGAEALPFASL